MSTNRKIDSILNQLQVGTLYANNTEPAMTNNRTIAAEALASLLADMERREKKLTLQLKAAELRASEAEAKLDELTKAISTIIKQLENSHD